MSCYLVFRSKVKKWLQKKLSIQSDDPVDPISTVDSSRGPSEEKVCTLYRVHILPYRVKIRAHWDYC